MSNSILDEIKGLWTTREEAQNETPMSKLDGIGENNLR